MSLTKDEWRAGLTEESKPFLRLTAVSVAVTVLSVPALIVLLVISLVE